MYCSKVCIEASTIPLAICFFGSVLTTVGSKKENFGNPCGPPIVLFSFSLLFEITAPEFISEPVAGKVNTVPKGKASVNLHPFFWDKTSQGSQIGRASCRERV